MAKEKRIHGHSGLEKQPAASGTAEHRVYRDCLARQLSLNSITQASDEHPVPKTALCVHWVGDSAG